MDRIVKSLVEDLLSSQEIKFESHDKDFERFVNYSIISKEFNKSFDIDDTLTGSGDDTGIDGIAVIVNGQMVYNKEDVEFLISNNNFLEATFIFIQSKTGNHFGTNDLNNFGYGVKDFFSETPSLRRNSEIKAFAELSNFIFSNASKFRDTPKCKLYFVTNGNWLNDQNCASIIDSNKDDLMKFNLFSSVEYTPVGANEIGKIYRETKNTVNTTFIFQDKVALPDLPNIKESYYGILPISEFKNILLDENGNMRNIFFDNIRDFQGMKNPVNTGIEDTLQSDTPEFFTVLNNGITIVASSLIPSGKNFTISDYQIVNGCQTSNVLYNYLKQKKYNELSIPIKLIITDDDEVKNRITVATNSQTAIKREQLKAMTEFQKTIEYFFNTYESDKKLFYERRSGQYQSDSSVVKARIVNIQNLIKAFSSMFFENPDRVTTYFGNIVKQNIENENPLIFNPNHKPILYYTSAFAFYRLDSLFRSNSIDTKYRKVKFFVLMLFRMLVNEKQLSKTFMNSDRHVNEYCNRILAVLYKQNNGIPFFQEAISIIKYSKLDVEDKQLIKQVNFTNRLKEAYKNYKSETKLKI
jgi:AIPR protein